MDEELDYVSSSPLLATAPATTKPQDEIDLPTLKKVQLLMAQQIALCDSNSTLDLKESEFKVKQQVFLNRRLAEKLTEVKLLVDTVIDNIKEKYSE